MKCAIAIFAKTIGMSPVKTRLAASIGQENAESFYRLSFAAVSEVLHEVAHKNTNVFPHWALADEAAVGLDEWSSFPSLWTGEGGLGRRLCHISNTLLDNHDAVFLIGTDSPQLSAKRILQFLEMLEVNPSIDHVAGPAKDGGFWLWGSRERLPLSVWEKPQYSVETTLEKLIAATNEYGHRHNVSIGYALQDVDVLGDLFTLQDTLEQRGKVLLPAQMKLLEWLQENNSTFQG